MQRTLAACIRAATRTGDSMRHPLCRLASLCAILLGIVFMNPVTLRPALADGDAPAMVMDAKPGSEFRFNGGEWLSLTGQRDLNKGDAVRSAAAEGSAVYVMTASRTDIILAPGSEIEILGSGGVVFRGGTLIISCDFGETLMLSGEQHAGLQIEGRDKVVTFASPTEFTVSEELPAWVPEYRKESEERRYYQINHGVEVVKEESKASKELEVETTRLKNKHFYLETDMSDKYAHASMDNLLVMYDRAAALFQTPASKPVWRLPIQIICFKHHTNTTRYYLKYMYKPEHGEWFVEQMKENPQAHFDHSFICLSYDQADMSKQYHLDVHNAAHVAFTHCFFEKDINVVMPWLPEGFALFMEDQVFGEVGIYCAVGDTYFNNQPVSVKSEQGGLRYAVKKMVEENKDSKLQHILKRDLANLADHESLKIAAVLYYMHDRDPEKFKAFIRRVKQSTKETQEAAFSSVWGEDINAFDDNFKAWIKEWTWTPPKKEKK